MVCKHVVCGLSLFTMPMWISLVVVLCSVLYYLHRLLSSPRMDLPGTPQSAGSSVDTNYVGTSLRAIVEALCNTFVISVYCFQLAITVSLNFILGCGCLL